MLHQVEAPTRPRADPDTAMTAPVTAPVLRLWLIGSMRVLDADGQSRLPAGRKTRALLAMLALSAPRACSRTRLAETLWSRRPEEQSRASLRQEIHRLINALGDTAEQVLTISREHVSLRADRVWVDAADVMNASPDAPDRLALLHDRLLDELDGLDPAFDSWLTTERTRLRSAARRVGEAVLLAQNAPERVAAAARQLITIDPLHEGAWQALIRSHAERGERGLAIEAFEQCQATLSERLGATPAEETQRLVRALRLEPTSPLAVAPAAPRRVGVAEAHGIPRLGVLPLRLAGGRDDDSFAAGLLTELTTSLARCDLFNLVPGDTAVPHSGPALDFLLDGMLQPAGDQIRVTLRLADLAGGGRLIWARRFDYPVAQPLIVGEEIAARTAAEIEPEILMAEARDASEDEAHASSGRALMLRAVALITRPDQDGLTRAGDLLAAAIASTPDSAQAHAWYALWQVMMVSQGWARDRAGAARHALALAERTVMLEPNQPTCLTIAGHVRALVERRLPEAMALHERALGRNPNHAMAWNLSGIACLYQGDLAEAERRLARYKTLAPLHPLAFMLDTGFVMLALLKHDYAAAASAGRGVCGINPPLVSSGLPCLAALGHLGQTQEAATLRRRLLGLDPALSVQTYLRSTPLRPADAECIADGLRRAGLPEGEFVMESRAS